MVLGFKGNKTNNSKQNKPVEVVGVKDSSKVKNKSILDDVRQKKKELLPKDQLTREEILKEIEQQFARRQGGVNDPFKTREDRYFLFYNSNMQLNRQPVPFEEIRIGGKVFFMNKRFENGRIIIEQLFASPDLEINLEEEYSKKQTTKKQLEKINKYLIYIKNKIAEGEEDYNLIDIEDLKEEKWRLEKILESIKYGKQAIFDFQDPITNKKAYMLRYCNGEYKYLKVTENNFLTEENNIKFLKGYDTQKKLEEVVNLRISRNWRQILIALVVIFICFGAIFGIYKLMTFEEDLFDKRVKDYCGEQLRFYESEVRNYKQLKCDLEAPQTPAFQTPS